MDINRYYNKIEEKLKLQMIKYQKVNNKSTRYHIGEKVLLKKWTTAQHNWKNCSKTIIIIYMTIHSRGQPQQHLWTHKTGQIESVQPSGVENILWIISAENVQEIV